MVIRASNESTQGFTGPNFPTFNDPRFGIVKSEPFFGDIGYSNSIPWPLISTAGWWHGGTIPEEKALIMRADPEYFAANDLIRSNAGLPTININDPIYRFERKDFTIPVGGSQTNFLGQAKKAPADARYQKPTRSSVKVI